MAINITSKKQLNELLNNSPNCILDFHAKWCGPCKQMNPTISALAKNYTVLKIDIDECDDIAADFGVRSVPTFVLVKNGRGVEVLVGGEKLVESVNKHFKK